MIDIRGLYKSFEDKTVLSNINASFENGKTNLIIGQSGSGKTEGEKDASQGDGDDFPECGAF